MRKPAVGDNVQIRPATAKRFCTQTAPGQSPLFFIGSSPSAAKTIINPEYPAYGVMISRPLLYRKADFEVSPLCNEFWIFKVRSHLYSCDSGAATYSKRFGDPRSELELNHLYQERMHAAITDSVPKRIPPTAGANNGQGRKPQWNRPTKAIRVPEEFADKLLAIAREWDKIGL